MFAKRLSRYLRPSAQTFVLYMPAKYYSTTAARNASGEIIHAMLQKNIGLKDVIIANWNVL